MLQRPDPFPTQGSEPAPDGTPAVPVEEASSDPRVAAALERLTSLDELSIDDHVAVYDAAHRDLQEALAEAASRDTTDPA